MTIDKNTQWRNALVIAQEYCKNNYASNLKYDIETMYSDHCCPPPIVEYQKDSHKVEKGTDTLWNGKRVLWCYPATPNEGAALKTDEKIPVGCLGCSFWNIIHALKIMGLEETVTRGQIETLKRISLQHKTGFAEAFKELGWAGESFTDPNLAQGGDLGVIGYGDELPHHWFVVAENPHILHKDNPALNTWSGSPLALGAGFDYWYKDKERNGKKRYWILCRPFVI